MREKLLFTILLSSYAPHIAEEIWSKLGNQHSITTASFPSWDENYLIEDEINYPISFNGKTRFTVSFSSQMTKEEIEFEIMQHEKTLQYLGRRTPKKIIVVPKRIVNIVV